MSNEIKLLPCPFCGGEADLIEQKHREYASTEKSDRIIPYGTKIIYHGQNSWKGCECYCGHYNVEDDTYNIYRGWDLCHVPKADIEVFDWQ